MPPGDDPPPTIADLDAYLEIVGSCISAGQPENRVPSLFMMALIVTQFPPGDLQDAAEDVLSCFIAEVRPNAEDLQEIRRIRMAR
jgi:hypothetical protein